MNVPCYDEKVKSAYECSITLHTILLFSINSLLWYLLRLMGVLILKCSMVEAEPRHSPNRNENQTLIIKMKSGGHDV